MVFVAQQQRQQQQIIDGAELDVLSPFDGFVRVSAETAGRWLREYNLDNRRVRIMLVEYLKLQIATGEWQHDHPQPVVFSTTRMIDGQHRLRAIVESGATVVVRVSCGVRDGLREYLDTGRPRGLEDRIAFVDDVILNRHVASVVSLWFWLNNRSVSRRIRCTPDDARKLFTPNSSSVVHAARFLARKHQGVCRVAVAVALCQMHLRSPDDAEAFGSALLIPDGDVQQARVLRDHLLLHSGVGGGEHQIAIHGRSVCAMKAAIDGRPIKCVRVASW